MKKKKLLMLLLGLLVVSIGIFSIYRNTYKEEYNYVALGDSLAAGRNPYGVDDYGYTDYIRDYLKNENKLKNYVSYAVSGYTTSDVIDDINYNKIINVDDKNVGIKKTLRESDLVTISIGANDFLQNINISSIPSSLSDMETMKNTLDNIFSDIEDLLRLIKQYAKGDIIVIGYYNPLPSLEKYKESIDQVIDYIDVKYKELCDNNNVYYVEISDDFESNLDCLPNPLDIHPNKEGYEIISKEVIKVIKERVFD